MNKNLILSSSVFVLANLYMAVGVLFWGWSLAMILIIFWLESGIVLLFAILKMIYAERDVSELKVRHGNHSLKPMKVGDIIVIAFYAVLFWCGTGFLLTSVLLHLSSEVEVLPMLSTLMNQQQLTGLLVLFVIFLFSHAFSFVTDYLPKERGLFSTVDLGVKALERTYILYLSVFIGGPLLAYFSATTLFALIFIAIKTIGDVVIHRREHTTRAALTPTT